MSAKWGYSIDYPDTWMEIPNYDGSDHDKYFSNENVGSPMQMDVQGINVEISVNGSTGDQCLQRGLRGLTPDRQTDVSVDGLPAKLTALTTEGFGEYIVNLQRSGYCYWFAFIFRSNPLRDATEPTVLEMLSHRFTFGTPTSAPSPQ
jgi:hypothetical protein